MRTTRGAIAFLVLVLVACSLTLSSLAEARPQHDPSSTPEERHAARHAGRSRDKNEATADAAAPVEGSPAKKVEAAAPAPSLRDLAGSNASGGGDGKVTAADSGRVKAKSSFSSSSSSSSSSPKAAMKCAPDPKSGGGDKLSNSPLGYAASQLANAPCARAASGIPDAAAAAAATPRKEPRGGVAGDVATAGLSESVEPQSLSEADRYFEDDDGSIAHPVAPVGEALGGGGGKKGSSSTSISEQQQGQNRNHQQQQQPHQQQQQQPQQPHHPPHHHHGGAAAARASENESEGQQQSAVDELAGAAARALSGNGNVGGSANLPSSASNAFQPRALPSQQPFGGGADSVADAVGGRSGGPSGDPLGDLSKMLEQASKLEQEVASSPLGEALPKLAEAVPQAAQTLQAAGQALTPVANDIAVGLANNLPALLPSIGALLGRRRLMQVATAAPAPAPSPAVAATATPLASSPLAALAARIGTALGLLPPPADDAQQPRPAQQAASFFT